MSRFSRAIEWLRGPSRETPTSDTSEFGQQSGGAEDDGDGVSHWDWSALAAAGIAPFHPVGAANTATGIRGGQSPGGNPPTPAVSVVAAPDQGQTVPSGLMFGDFHADLEATEPVEPIPPTEGGRAGAPGAGGEDAVAAPASGGEPKQEQVANQTTTRAALSARQRATMALVASPVGRATRIVLALLWGTGKERVIDPAAERAAVHMMGSLDSVGGDEDAALLYATLHQRNRCAGQIALEVKAADGFMTPKYSEANVLVVQRKVADLLARRNVRKSHIPHLVPIAVALVFTPTKEEIMMQQFMASQVFADRQRDAGAWARIEDGKLVQGPVASRA